MYTTGKPERLRMMAFLAAQWSKLHVKVLPHVVKGYPDFFGPWEQGGILVHGAFQVGELAEVGGPNPDDLGGFMNSANIDRLQAVHNWLRDVNYAGIRDTAIDKSFSQAAQSLRQTVRRRDFETVQ
jgi:hypothetical protein